MRCETCKHMGRIRAALAPCQSCDNGSHHGCSHVIANDFTLSKRVDDEHTQQASVTTLDPDNEDKLRKAMSSLFALDPLDLMLVQHLFKGGRLSTFNKSTLALSRRLSMYHGSPRAQAHAAKERISRTFPLIAPILQQLVDGNNGIRHEALDAENEVVESCGTIGQDNRANGKSSKSASKRKVADQGELFQ